jgi:hypothetical protein
MKRIVFEDVSVESVTYRLFYIGFETQGDDDERGIETDNACNGKKVRMILEIEDK